MNGTQTQLRQIVGQLQHHRRIMIISGMLLALIVGATLQWLSFRIDNNDSVILNASLLITLVINGGLSIKKKNIEKMNRVTSVILLFQAFIISYFEISGAQIGWLLFIIFPFILLPSRLLHCCIYIAAFIGCNVYLWVALSHPDVYTMNTFPFIIGFICEVILCLLSTYYLTQCFHALSNMYEEGVHNLAYYDQLTGLANRWSFENWATKKLQTCTNNKKETALVFIDFDNFKEINDTYGHNIGDKVLSDFATRLKNSIRTKNRQSGLQDFSIARFGGDEFVILLYDVKSKSDMNHILERICSLFDNYHQLDSIMNSITVSVGVARYPEDAKDLQGLIKFADKAMYSAKKKGKNQYCYFDAANNCYRDDRTLGVYGQENNSPTVANKIRKLKST